MQGSRDKLKDVLQDKLLNYEAGVTRETSDAILARVHAVKKPASLIRKALYSTGLIVIMGSLYFYTQLSNTEVDTKYAAASVASGLTERKTSPGNETPAEISRQTAIEQTSHETRRVVSARPPVPEPAPDSGKEPASVVSVPPETDTHPMLALGDDRLEDTMTSQSEIDEPGSAVLTVQTAKQVVVEPTPPEKTTGSGAGRISLSIGLMPTLNYKRLVPNGNDAAYLHDFEVPSSGDKSRFGYSTSLLVYYSLKKERSIYTGIGLFSYRSQFTYESSEVASSVSAVNEVDETLQGVSLFAGMRLPLLPNRAHRHNLDIGGQLQLPESGPQFVAQAGFEYGMKLSHGLLTIQPTLFYSVTPIHYRGLIAYPYGGGIDLRYELPVGRRE